MGCTNDARPAWGWGCVRCCASCCREVPQAEGKRWDAKGYELLSAALASLSQRLSEQLPNALAFPASFSIPATSDQRPPTGTALDADRLIPRIGFHDLPTGAVERAQLTPAGLESPLPVKGRAVCPRSIRRLIAFSESFVAAIASRTVRLAGSFGGLFSRSASSVTG